MELRSKIKPEQVLSKSEQTAKEEYFSKKDSSFSFGNQAHPSSATFQAIDNPLQNKLPRLDINLNEEEVRPSITSESKMVLNITTQALNDSEQSNSKPRLQIPSLVEETKPIAAQIKPSLTIPDLSTIHALPI